MDPTTILLVNTILCVLGIAIFMLFICQIEQSNASLRRRKLAVSVRTRM